jgi:hypothetical protein
MKKFKEKFNLKLPKNESIHKLRNDIEHKKMIWNDDANKQPFRGAQDLKNGYYNSPTIIQEKEQMLKTRHAYKK